MFILQAVLFFLLPLVSVYFLLAAISFIIVSCYGGRFGTMPAFNADYFGPTNVGTNYGLMLTAWGFGGVLGPLLIPRVIDTTDSYTLAFYIIAAIHDRQRSARLSRPASEAGAPHRRFRG